MPFDFPNNFVQSGNSFINELKYIIGGVKQSVATVADLETYQDDSSSGRSATKLNQSMLVYVQGGNGYDTNPAVGWWYYDGTDGVAEEDDWGWKRLSSSMTELGGGLALRDETSPTPISTSDTYEAANTPETVQFIGGNGLSETEFTNVNGTVHELTFAVDFTNTTANELIMSDSNTGFTTAGISYDDTNGYSFDGVGDNSSAVTIGTLNVSTLNATTEVTTANLSTSDTFIRIADPSTFTQVGTGDADQSEFANAVNAGFIVNTGYYDDNAADNTADPAYSTHKLLYWDSTLSEWLLRDGDPNGGATSESDRFDAAENNFVDGTSHFLRNFYASKQAIHFGKDTVFSFNTATGTNNPGFQDSDDGLESFMKTRYVPTLENLRGWTQFFDPGENSTTNLYTDYSWNDDDAGGDGDDDAANTMANTYVRYGRVVKAKVQLEGSDIIGTNNHTIKVYHGGIFGSNEIPMVKVYALKSGTEGTTGAEYEEIMVNVTQTYGEDFVEITFNTGYLTTTAGTGNILHVRMFG